MTRERTVYTPDHELDAREDVHMIHPAWVVPPESLTVTDTGGHVHLFTKKES